MKSARYDCRRGKIAGRLLRLILWTSSALLAGCANPFLHASAPSVTPPSFSPGGGVFGTDQSVTLKAASGATVHYTTNGSTPTASSAAYTAPIPVAGNGTSETIEAIAVKDGKDSAVATASFSINYSIGGTATLAAPTFSPSSGNVADNQPLTLSYPSGASVYYTTNGSVPSASNGTLYNPSTGITLSGANGSEISVKAVSVESGFISSPVVSAGFIVTNRADTVVPTISISDPSGQISTSGTNLTWSSTPPSFTLSGGTGATTFYYVVSYDNQNPTPPSTSSTSVTGSPATVALSPPDSSYHSVTIEALAVDPSTTPGPVQKKTYYLNEAVAAPAASAGTGRYGSNQSITFSDTTPGASVSLSGTATDYLSGGSAWTGGTIALGPSASVTLSAIGPLGGYAVTATASLAGWENATLSETYYVVSPKLIFTASQTLTVPSIPASYPGGSIGSITAKLWGAGGAAGDASGGSGGGGGFAEQSISVSGGQVYTVTVGSPGQLVDPCPATPQYTTAGKGGGMSAIASSAGYLAIAGGGGGGGMDTTSGYGGAGGQSGGHPSGAYGGGYGVDGTGTAPVSGGTGGTAGTGTYNGSAGGATAGGQGGGYTFAGWGGAGYGGGGGGGANASQYGAGAGGGGNYGDIIVDGSARTPGNSGDPDLASGYAYGGTTSSTCGGAGEGGYVVISVN